MYFCYFLSLELEEKVFPSPESTHVNENEVKDSDAASDSNEEDWFLYHLIIFNSHLHMFTRRAQYARQQVPSTTHFSPTHLSWAGFRPVSRGRAKNEYCNTKGIFLPC